MAIDKRIPRVLNSDADNKTANKVSMSDALNLYSGPDNEDFDATGKKLDAGKDVLKNIRGNVEVPAHEGEALPSDARVLGSVEDAKTDITYFFVYSANGGNHGVYAYDKRDVLSKVDNPDAPLGPPIIRRIYRSAQFNFPQNGFVKGDIVYSAGSRSFPDHMGDDFDKDVIIYFTDGANEPRKINAYRAFADSFGEAIHGTGTANQYAEADFITACPKAPLKPIEFRFENDETRSVSNFQRTDGFQFAYQHIYKDGVESSISSYSDVAFPPSVLGQGAKTFIDHSVYNKCVLTVPECGPEITIIRLLCRQGNAGSFSIIDEIEAGVTSYDFYNDKTLKGVSTTEVNKQFDSVPRKAKAQTVSSNRLMYGNYLDGFDKTEASATATVIYKDRPTDYLSFDIGFIPSIYSPNGSYNAPLPPAENAAFILDFSEMPESLPAGTNIDISLTLTPDRNFHIYGSTTSSQTRQRGPQPLSAANNVFDGVNAQQENSITSAEALAAFGDSGLPNLFASAAQTMGATNGLLNIDGGSTWKYTGPSSVSGVAMDDVLTAKCGTSATNPLIIKGGPVTFSIKLFVPEDIEDAKSKINKTVRFALPNKNLPSSTFPDPNNAQEFVYPDTGITILESTPVSSYEFDLGLGNANLIKQAFVGQESSIPDERNKLINAVFGMGKSNESGVPVGHFIFNKGKPTFMLANLNGDQYDSFGQDQNITSHFSLHLVDFANAEPLTCIHDTPTSFDYEDIPATSWIVVPPVYMEDYGANMTEGFVFNTTEGLSTNDYVTYYGLGVDIIQGFQNSPGGDNSVEEVTKGYGYQLGYLQPATQFATEFSPLQDRYVSHSFLRQPVGYEGVFGTNGFYGSLTTSPLYFLDQSGLKLMDGEGGPGGGPAKGIGSSNMYDRVKMYAQGSVTVNPYIAADPDTGENYPRYSRTVFYGGSVRALGPADASNQYGISLTPTTLPFLYRRSSFNYEYQLPTEDQDNPGFLASDPDTFEGALSVNFKLNQSAVEATNNYVNFYGAGGTDFNGVESFKTEANHDFGIVYYDERGRHGFVNYLDSAFVEGYSTLERGENKGGVEISIQLNSAPPSWAHSYKIVYNKNSTVQNFVQYISGGAFVAADREDVFPTDPNKNIYVSLNYLQGHPISYVNAFGARTPEGGLNLYKFKEGDKVRVISYFDNGGINYVSHEFDISDLIVLGDQGNPLGNEPIPENQKGEFLIIKDNSNAFGFSYSDVSLGNDFWSNNCLIEIRSPKKAIEEDEQIYYEVSDHYKVAKNSEAILVHDVNPVVVNNGDVWFRPVAANLRELVGGEYVDIILNDDGDDSPSQPNFKNVYMETESASDLFKSNSFSRGRPNVIFEDATETRREATITYSDASNPESPKIRYSSFNASTANFKDLVDRYGDIQYMGNHDPFVVVIQKEKISLIPVDKNILSDASGNQQLIASLNVLGEVITYGGVSGCDDDPSSVYDSEEEVYFCNKSLSKVYRFTRQSGVEEISELGMSSLIRASLKTAVESGDQVRLIGGFDTLKEEYLFSIANIPIIDTYGVDFVSQDQTTVAPTELEPNIVINPADVLDFGELSLTDTIQPREVIISNTGLANLIITDFDINDGEAINFELVSFNSNVSADNPMEIEPGGSETILISIIPPAGQGPINSFLEVYSNDLESPHDLNLTVSFRSIGDDTDNGGSEDDSDSGALLPLLDAYNNFYEANLQQEEMSQELAFQYLQDLEGTPGEPTLSDLANFLGSANNNQFDVNRVRFDTDADGLVSSFDLTQFLAAYGDEYQQNTGMFSGLDPASGSAPLPKALPPPPNKPKPSTVNYFKDVDGAINYLFVQNELTVGEYHLLRAQINDNFSLNLNEQGPVNTTDVVKMLQVFSQTTDPNEPAFASTPTSDQGGIPSGPSSLETILWIINDGTMTVGQYFYLASYVKLAAKADADENNLISTYDLLIILSVWGFGTQDSGTSYDLNDLAFNL